MAQFSYRISKADTLKRSKGQKPLKPTETLTKGTFESPTMQTAHAEFDIIIAETVPPETEFTDWKYSGDCLLNAQKDGRDKDGYRYIITLIVLSD